MNAEDKLRDEIEELDLEITDLESEKASKEQELEEIMRSKGEE